MENLTEPLLSEAQDDAALASKDNGDPNKSSTLLTTEVASDDYVPLVDSNDSGDANHSINVDVEISHRHNHQNETYSLDPRRFAILAIFCLNGLIGSAVWITFAPIEDAVIAKFQGYTAGNDSSLSPQQINWLSMISMAVYGPGTAFCAWVVPNYGFRETVIWSSFVMSLGCFLRWMSLGIGSDEHLSLTARYSILLTGQALVALGQTIFTNAPARVAASWFQQTTKSIGAINLCSNLGVMFGQALSPLCVIAATGEHLDQLLFGQGMAMVLCTLFTTYSFRYEEPEHPPSASESARRRERQFEASSSNPEESVASGVLKDVKTLLTNPQYIILVIAFGLNYSLNGAVVTLIQPWLALCGFPGDETAGLFGALLIGGGVVGTWIASALLDVTRNYNQAIRWSFASTAIVGVGFVASLYPKCPTWILGFSFTVTGMTQIPLVTIACDSVAAHTFPVPEELSSAGLQMAGQYLSVFLIDGMSSLIESESDDDNQEKFGFSAKVNIAYLSLLFMSSAFACCYMSEDVRANVANSQGIIQNHGDQAAALLEDSNNNGENSDTRSSNMERG